MDISRISRTAPATAGKSARGAGSSGGFSQLLETQGAATASVGNAGVVGGLDALLAVQEAGSALERRTRARRRASNLLEGLDQIRDGLLTGQVSQARLSSLAAMVAEQRDDVGDPQLDALLDEIELRVHVELAKLEYASSDTH